MTEIEWFDHFPVIGDLPFEQLKSKLIELDEDEIAASLEQAAVGEDSSGTTFAAMDWLRRNPQPWQHTAHTFGYIAPAAPGTAALPIAHAASIAPDPTLKKARIKITLDAVRVAKYPGKGVHRILFDFYAQNQVRGGVEHLHFNATYRIQDGERAALLGFPIFVGLNVATDGVVFKCFTVNVQNDSDEAFLGFLESDMFKEGLQLSSTVQPALALLSGTCYALTSTIARRSRNVPVQDFYMGLDFSQIVTGARLAEGSYIAVQIPETLQAIWDWNDWQFSRTGAQIVSKTDPSQLIPFNYIVFSVSRYEGS